MRAPLVSIIIDNYNYAGFLGAAIDSALHQTYDPIEVIVVDDGSKDRSRAIIAEYESRIVPVLKENGGQASAFNSGFMCSSREILCFLDADDFFYPDKVREVVEVFQAANYLTRPVFVSHWLDLFDQRGRVAGRRGSKATSRLNLYDYAKRYRFTYPPSGPTSGISLNRQLSRRIFPLPERGLSVGADDFVRRAASLVGGCYAMDKVLGAYRTHGDNRGYASAYELFLPAGHIEQLEDYLNEVLVANRLEPVISFRNSMYFCQYLVERGEWLVLPKNVLRAFLRHPDLRTLRFMFLLAGAVFRRWRPAFAHRLM